MSKMPHTYSKRWSMLKVFLLQTAACPATLKFHLATKQRLKMDNCVCTERGETKEKTCRRQGINDPDDKKRRCRKLFR